MPAVKKFKPLGVKSWFSIIVVVLLFGAILITQLGTLTSRDNRSQAATCGSGQNSLTLRPNGDFSTGNFAKSPASGTFYSKVDEAGGGDGDSSFVWDDTVDPPGSTILFNQPGSNWTGLTINSVTVSANTKEPPGSTAYLYIALGNGSSTAYSATKFGSANVYEVDSYTWSTNPFGGSWTASAVNGLKIGLKSSRQAQSNALNVTQVWMEVCYSPTSPSVDIKANGSNGPITIGYNTAATISWSSTNATSCTVAFPPGSWSGTSGTQGTGNLTSGRTYNLSCTGSGGSAQDSVVVNVAAAPPPPPPPPAKPPAKPPPASPPPSSPPTGPPTSPPPSQTGDPTDITVNFAENSFPRGLMPVTLAVEGTNLNQKLSIAKAASAFALKTNGALQKNQTYILKLSARGSLVQRITFTYLDFTKIAAGPLVMGDFNSDAKIDLTDLGILVPEGMKSQKEIHDINFDGVVNSVDYSQFLVNLGKVS